MSVVPMKLLTVAGPLARFDDVMASCVIDQEFHPENALQLMKKVSGLRPLSFTNPYTPLLRRAEEVITSPYPKRRISSSQYSMARVPYPLPRLPSATCSIYRKGVLSQNRP